MNDYDLAVVGGGPAGLSAGIYAGRRTLKTAIFETALPGGSMNWTTNIDNYPGFTHSTGMEIAAKMKEHAEAAGAEIINEEVMEIAKKEGGGFVLKTAAGSEYFAKAIILATGAEHRKLGAKGEDAFKGKGVSYCATCDAPLFRGKKVAVVGGGNTAITDALVLADLAAKVYIIHRKDVVRAEGVLVKRLDAAKNVEKIYNSVVLEIAGDKFVKQIKIIDTATKQQTALDVDGVFIAVGTAPASALAASVGAEVDDAGHIKTDARKATTCAGVFAAGDVTGGPLQQVVTAAADGAIAAVSAHDYVKKAGQ